MFDYTKVSDSCIKCGKCIPVCTIHQNNHDEVTSPRGFIDLLGAKARGELELDRNAKEIFESCFLCTNCVDSCPNDLPTDMIIEEVRYELAQKYGIAWYKRAFFWLLRNRWAMDIFNKMGYVFSTCGLKKHENGLSARFDLPVMKKDRLLPSMRFVSFLNKYPARIKSKGSTQRVAIFIGCLANYNYREVGDSLVSVLKKLGIEIYIPKKQKCCGAPAYFTGDFDTVEHLIKANVDYFETFIDEVDAIIIPEATCSAMIKHDWEKFLQNRGDSDYKARVQKINEKVFMATEWLYKHTNLNEQLKEGKQLDDIVTYHDPCHARKVQGIYQEPRALIASNYVISEMSEPNRCCGFGGVTMQTEKFHLAQSAGKPKAQMIADANASIVSAECSACRVQLSNAMHENEVKVRFKNPIELIDKAL
jgi:glycolate oxidase iron-sulfur subunit